MADDKSNLVEPFYWSKENRALFPDLEIHAIRAGDGSKARAEALALKSLGLNTVPQGLQQQFLMAYETGGHQRDSALSLVHEGRRVGFIFKGEGLQPFLENLGIRLPTRLDNALTYFTHAHEAAHLNAYDILGIDLRTITPLKAVKDIARKFGIHIKSENVSNEKRAGNFFLANEKIADLFGVAMTERRYGLTPGSFAQTAADIRILGLNTIGDPMHFTTHPLDAYQAFHDKILPTDTPRQVFAKAVEHVGSTWNEATISTRRIPMPDLSSMLGCIHDIALESRDPVTRLNAERTLAAIERLTELSRQAGSHDPEVKAQIEETAKAVKETRAKILEKLATQPGLPDNEKIPPVLEKLAAREAETLKTSPAAEPPGMRSSKRFASIGKGGAKSLPAFAAAGAVGLATFVATLSPSEAKAAASDTLNVSGGANPTNGSWVGGLTDAVVEKGNDITSGARLIMDGEVKSGLRTIAGSDKPKPDSQAHSKSIRPAPPVSI